MQQSFFDLGEFAPTLTVTQLARRIKDVVEDDDILRNVWVRGEVSNFIQANSGHVYFTLKDHDAAIRCVVWRHDAARVIRLPKPGDAIEVHGTVSMYEARGDVQLYVDEIKLSGTGALWEQFEKLRARLGEEGLFAPEHKRPLPKFPSLIGVVTSREGAVLRDICHVVRRRYPLVQILLVPTLVQGNAAAEMIAAALGTVNRYPVDVVILARGGGSVEDLWCFNAECVARAIFQSRVPVISAVGHETDFTIADFVADLRAPTPSAAAELVVADRRELAAAIYASTQRLAQQARDCAGQARVRLGNAVHALQRNSPQAQVLNDRQRVDELTYRLTARTQQLLAVQREQLNGATRHLAALNPEATLARGYAIVREKDGPVVKRRTQVHDGTELTVRVSDGEFEATVKDEG